MKVSEKKKLKDKVLLAMEGDLNIYSVKELKGQLSEYFENIKNFEVDLSAVGNVDTAGFQFLAMLKKEVNGRDKIFSITNPSEEIVRIFNLYGEAL
ncbi:MAG: STAS domain-containing protein [Spirochaetes bacterium]|nr:STAS domain-containing protein [Spirochaetota bacterium]